MARGWEQGTSTKSTQRGLFKNNRRLHDGLPERSQRTSSRFIGMKLHHEEIGMGATEVLSLRVSVATLVRVLFKHPFNGELLLALERKATLHETENSRVIDVRSQPFGRAIRILDVNRLRDGNGDFHFDSVHSQADRDFRLFIRPS